MPLTTKRPVKRPLGVDVLTAARQRIATVFDRCERVYVSVSGGKDSTVLYHLAADEARRRERRLGVLIVDLEAQYTHTIAHLERCVALHADVSDVHWVALPLTLRNAVSAFAPQWTCWDLAARDVWVREPPAMAITDPAHFPFFRSGMEFEEFTPAFGHWFATQGLAGSGSAGARTACLVGIRAVESLNRWRTLFARKQRLDDLAWTTWLGGALYNAYPLYDWRTEDVWTYHAVHPEQPSNPVYDLMHRAGLSIHQQRLCQPYGDDQRKGLWLYHVLEPETWGRVVARVAGANAGALYARESGNMLGRLTVSLPPGHTWQSFTELLLASQPPAQREHYENKIAVFLKWWTDRGFPHGIPDEADPKLEAARKVPSWRRVCRVLLRHDFWCKGLSFTQHVSTAYDRYRQVMKHRRAQWGIY